MSQPLRILVIEDVEDDAILLERALRRGGYAPFVKRIETAEELRSALENQTWDLITSDYNLPGFNAPEALKIVQSTNLDLPFIIISGAIGESSAVTLMKSGAHDYLMKDNLSRLIPAIERELKEAESRRQRRQAEQEIRQRNRELTLLNKVMSVSVTNLAPEAMLEVVCTELVAAFNLPQASAALLDHTRMNLEVVAEAQQDGGRPLLNEAIAIPTTPLFERLLQAQEAVIVSDVPNDPHLTILQHLMVGYRAASVLLLPLASHGETIGCLGLAAKQHHKFTSDEITLARQVADQIAGVLARSRLNQQFYLLNQAIEQTTEGVMISDETGTIRYVNPIFERMTGFSRAELIGKTPTNTIKSGKHEPAFYQKIDKVYQSGQTWQGRIINKKKDGTLYTVAVVINPVRNEQGIITNYIDIHRDITRELELEEQYHQSQKMEAVGQLTAGIAHDFNNLLTAINGFSELILRDLTLDDKHQNMLKKVIQAGQRATTLIGQLMAFSHKQVIAPQIISLNEVVSRVESLLRRIIGEHIKLESSLSTDLCMVKVDPTQIEQVLLNLAVNARDAMPEGGKLTIETSNIFLDKEQIVGYDGANPDKDLTPGEHAQLVVTDTGIGISKEIQPRIFEPFFTTKDLGQGTGLGLSTVYGIVKQSGGHIQVVSEPGQGSQFKIFLPRALELPHPQQPEVEISQALNPGTETILLVEDEPGVRRLVTMILEAQGYTVLEVEDGPQALSKVEQHALPIHLLLTDVVMPGMSGKALAEKLKQRQPDLKVLYMSGYTDDIIAQHGVLESGIAFIQKPFQPMALVRKVQKILEE